MVDIIDTTDLDGVQYKDQGTNVATPTSGFKRIFAKAAGMFFRNSAGTVAQLAELNSSGFLVHEDGGLEADVSAGDGFVEVKGGSTTVVKSKLNAITAPGVTDDGAAGYSIGSTWIDTTGDKAYTCLDSTNGAAVWTETTQTGGGAPDQDLFDIFQGDSGTDPVADSATDTLIIAGGTGIDTVGDSSLDKITINAVAASTSVSGISELATQAEATAGTDTTRSIVPSVLPEIIQGFLYSYAVDAEASDTYVISLTPSISAYVDGAIYSFDANTVNTGAATLNIDSVGAKAIVKNGGTALDDGDIAAGQRVIIQYNSTDDDFEMVSQLGNASGSGSINYIHISHDDGSDYTTTSSSFVDVDATDLNLTITTTGGKVLCIANFSYSSSTNEAQGNFTFFDNTNSSNLGNATGGLAEVDDVDSTDTVNQTVMGISGALSAGAHSFKLRWKRDGGTSKILSNNVDVFMILIEVG